MRDFLEGPCSSFSRDAPGARRVAWASRPNRAVREARSRHPDRIVNIEDGFIRSAGLGAAFKPASSIVLDERGIYYDPGSSSNLEHMLLTASFDPPLLARAKALRRRIVALRLSKYNLRAADFQAPAGRRVILVPGQVENDASVLAGGCGLSNTDLIERVRRDNPDAFVVYKPHPDVVAGYRPGAVVAARLRGLVDRTVEDADVLACIDAAHEVHTLTSLTGFEALLRGKTVVAYGWPFYAGWGLTRDEGPAPAPRRRLLTLDELVAATLILYPLYLDPVSRLPCDVETFLKRLSEQAHVPAPRGHGRYLSAVRQMLTPSRRQPY